VIQRNLIEYPRAGANDWERPCVRTKGISLIDSRGGTSSVTTHPLERTTTIQADGIGGGSNLSLQGKPATALGHFTEIVSHCWDDAIESEAEHEAVRIWSN